LFKPKEFPNPTTIDPRRPKESYNLNGVGFHICTGVEYAQQTIAEILRVVFKLQNVRRASGDAGRLSGFTEIVDETEINVFIKPNGTTSPWPGSMYLVVSRRYVFIYKKHGFLILTVGFQYDQ
jgi:linoleate 10R-lipoxygenase